MNRIDQTKLEWIKERYDYLLDKKFEQESLKARMEEKCGNGYSSKTCRSKIMAYKIEMMRIDDERTMICLKENKFKFR